MIAPARHPRIDEPVETRRQIFDHTGRLPSPRTGNGRHHPQSAAGPTFMREPWPALQEALAFARGGDTLIVWKLDRLARSMKQLIETIEELRQRGVGFRSLTEALDTTTAQGRLVFHMFGALAEFERSLIRERTQAGLAAARRLGRTGGRPPKLTEDDIEAAKAMLANPDIAVTQIAQRLGVSPATLYRYLPAARTANSPGV